MVKLEKKSLISGPTIVLKLCLRKLKSSLSSYFLTYSFRKEDVVIRILEEFSSELQSEKQLAWHNVF